MGLLSWIIVGGLAGMLAQFLLGQGRAGCLLTIVLGVVGAFIGGFVMSLLGYGGVDGLNVWSIVVATIGAVVLLAIARVLRR
ncbi:MAG: GlsB/YeaQ/YmgE family stress response membrane protein [Coriobacteriia bacterium]|nr:GlsB/YeaQ/YmgE family stress response membrane protein [Coriobacteriia bacterium]